MTLYSCSDFKEHVCHPIELTEPFSLSKPEFFGEVPVAGPGKVAYKMSLEYIFVPQSKEVLEDGGDTLKGIEKP